MPIAPQVMLPPIYRRPARPARQRRRALGFFGFVPLGAEAQTTKARATVVRAIAAASSSSATPKAQTPAMIIRPPVYIPPVGPEPVGPSPIWGGQPLTYNPNSPVPANYPTNQIYTNPSTGQQYVYQLGSGWISYGSGAAATGASVPTNYPTNQIYTNPATGVQYAWNASTGWQPLTTAMSGTTYPGTPVPLDFPTSQIYTNPDGSQWVYSSTTNTWIPLNAANAALYQAAQTGGASGAAPSVSVMAPASGGAPGPYDSIINFATQDSLIGGIPNWIIGVGLIFAWKMFGKGR